MEDVVIQATMNSETEDVLPPGQAPCDPSAKNLDAIGFALALTRQRLLWIAEYLADFKDHRDTHVERAEAALNKIEDSVREGREHLDRLIDLLLAGYNIDPNKRLHPDLVDWYVKCS